LVGRIASESSLGFVELTKQHKVLLGVVGLGVAAVAVDRLVLGSAISGPSEVAAAVDERAAAPQAALPRSEQAPQSLAARVDQLPEATSSRSELEDAFRLPATVGQAVGRTAAGVVAATASDAFRLSSVMTRPVPAAVVNGNMLRSGHDYAFAASTSGAWTLLKDDEVAARRRDNPNSIRGVRLESVRARTSIAPGSAVIIVDGTERHELVIQASEK
jgi:hypothetical protein